MTFENLEKLDGLLNMTEAASVFTWVFYHLAATSDLSNPKEMSSNVQNSNPFIIVENSGFTYWL